MSTLNAYESDRVREIALWKSERPSLLLASYRKISRPLSKLVSWVVPKAVAKEALAGIEAVSEVDDPAADILREAGASSIGELLHRPLEECDRLAAGVSGRAQHLALLEGVGPAAIGVAFPEGGGALAAVLDVPVLLRASIRAVRKIGHCYGFPLDTQEERRFVLAVLDIANRDDPAGLEEQRERLWEKGGPPGQKPDGTDASQAIQESVVDDLPIEMIPVVGDVANLVLDFAFVRRVDLTARRVFQERWLRSNGKVESIPPAPESRRRSSVEGLVAVGSEIAYTGAYGVSFGVTFPATLAALAVGSLAPVSVLQGFRDGASAATRDSRGLLEGLRSPAESKIADATLVSA